MGAVTAAETQSKRSFSMVQGLDISCAMLDIAREREVEGDLCLQDLGQGLPLRAGIFDGAISISAIQWLCNAVGSSKARLLASVATLARRNSQVQSSKKKLLTGLWHLQDTKRADPRKRMRRFFETLYACLAQGARAVLQMYPENADQVRSWSCSPHNLCLVRQHVA